MPGVKNQRNPPLACGRLCAIGDAEFWQDVQFIHESVRDFLLKDGGLYDLWPELGADPAGVSHDRLRECCQNYINTDTMPSKPWTLGLDSDYAPLPLLGYASYHILNHAARSALSISHKQFFETFRFGFWYQIVSHIDEYCPEGHQELWPDTERPSLLYALAAYNCSDLIRTLCRDGPVFGRKEGRHHYPLLAALVNGHCQAAQALLDLQKSSTLRWPVWELVDCKNAEHHEHPMLWALQNGQKVVASLLLNAKDLIFTTLCRDGRDMLSWAAEAGSEEVIAWIVRVGKLADMIDRPDEADKRPLAYATAYKRIEMISVLRAYGADMNATNLKGRTVMHYGRDTTTMKALLLNGANIEFQDEDGFTPLVFSALSDDGYACMQALLGTVPVLMLSASKA